ncbi:right-handed parallel beta-helix repeat-containing protein [Salinispora sp. H7-4]|uniref:right-handed parallel beta-helix repeat-containing protein n=1 Tax=Salinispora sp. H7-4 TaxID=2748321 RepID=UPI0015D3655C|nr:right-handed parallel beta-helix repeat-containing protein [Salinispora sp. H7-4]NYT93157.1 right-handed parallel beta-helix repeat-containing protein [Salinispora sp. H7-4]
MGLAGMTGLALSTVGGVAASPATDAVGRTLTAADDHGYDRGKHDDKARDGDKGRHDEKGRGSEKKPTGIPVPCDADALIAQITLANARGGAVLDLAKDCTYLLTADIFDSGLPAITTPITLNGGKHTTIERAAAAVGQFRIFTVDVGGDLTLNKLTVTGGQTSDDDGGGIFVNAGGALTTNHSTITRNIASGGNSGGGIANLGTTRINHSAVVRNTAGFHGGGIYSAGLLEIVKSHIDNNTSGDNGGGIFSTSSTVTVKGGSISGNQGANGAGMFLSTSIGTVTGTRITGNTSSGSSGGIRAGVGSQLTMRHVSLADNTASCLDGGLFVSGPGEGESFATVEDSVINNNVTSTSGGGIFNAGQTVLRHTKVIGNQADQGGGIYNEGTISLFTTKVVENIATTDGGGIYNNNGTVNLNTGTGTGTGTIVIKNRPNNCVDVPGCAG